MTCGAKERRTHDDSGNLPGTLRAECRGTWVLGPAAPAPGWRRGEGSAKLVSQPLATSKRPILPAWLQGDQVVKDQREPGSVARQERSQTTCSHGQLCCSDFTWFKETSPWPAVMGFSRGFHVRHISSLVKQSTCWGCALGQVLEYLLRLSFLLWKTGLPRSPSLGVYGLHCVSKRLSSTFSTQLAFSKTSYFKNLCTILLTVNSYKYHVLIGGATGAPGDPGEETKISGSVNKFPRSVGNAQEEEEQS